MTNTIQSTEEIQNFKGKYPRQLWYLFFSEMWERFSFYGMRGMLIYFMVTELMLDETVANLQYGAIQAFVYAFTFVGGLFADKILGFRRSLFWGGILMIIGSMVMAADPHKFLFAGIGFIIIGTGFFKPNISTIVGNLYKEGDQRIDAGFSLFYAGVNLGALLGGYLCVAIGKGELFASIIPEALHWNVAFGLAAVVMIISLLTFTQTQKSLGIIGISPLLDIPKKKRNLMEYATYLGSLLAIPLVIMMVSKTEYTDVFMYCIGPATLLYIVYEMRNYSWAENKKLIAAIIFMFLSIFFWAFFEQSGGSLSLFAAFHLDNNLIGLHLDPNGVNNSANSLFVITFASVLGMLWLWMNKKKIEPNTVVKFGLAFLFLGIGFYIFYYTRFFSNPEGVSSLNVFTTGWLVITFGELCLSPIGMSTMTKLSPKKLQAVVMGMWFLASAYGQYFAGLFGAGIASASQDMQAYDKMLTYTEGFKQLGLYSLIIGGVVVIVSPFIRKLMGAVK
ncbi:MAG: peptide MFS transporter [Bacteroidia bacterium]|nr:peptide MFS transporter [Bacteroidia bacterium]